MQHRRDQSTYPLLFLSGTVGEEGGEKSIDGLSSTKGDEGNAQEE